MTSGKCRYRGNLPESLSGECIKTAPKSRAGFEHENAAKLAFLGLKRPPFRGYKHHGMQQI